MPWLQTLLQALLPQNLPRALQAIMAIGLIKELTKPLRSKSKPPTP